MRVADFVTAPSLAETVPTVDSVTGVVVIVNVPVADPAGTITVLGTTTATFDEVSATVVGLGATAVNVTVPVAVFPPATEVGEIVKVERVGIATAMSCVNVMELRVAETTELPAPAAFGLAVTVNVAVVDPARTVTLSGTVT